MYTATTGTKKILKLKKRIRAIQGGTSAGKTIAILLILIDIAQSSKEPVLISVVSESLPHLRRGAMKDFLSIMKTHGYFKDDSWNKTESTYKFETGSTIEFFGADQPDKLRGARRDILFMNECNNMHYDAFDQLEVRTKKFIYLDWNPTNEFWFYTEVQPNRNDVDHLIINYTHNESLDPNIVEAIEKRKHNKRWWKVYGMGELGEVDGRIYTGWEIIDEIPHEARLVRRGVDFGYSNDPTSCVEVYEYNGGYILNETLYLKGLSNRKIADHINVMQQETDKVPVVCDSAEPKSIDELKDYGIQATPAQKGPGSINQGVQFVQDQKISVTKNSANLIREFRNYIWNTDKNGLTMNQPDPLCDDHALDAVRYALTNYKPQGRALPGIRHQFRQSSRVRSI